MIIFAFRIYLSPIDNCLAEKHKKRECVFVLKLNLRMDEVFT